MELITFTVPGEPVGKARPRMTRSGRAYTPKGTVSYENRVIMYFTETYPDWIPDEREISMTIVAYYSIPKSITKKKLELIRADVLHPTKKPDADNVLKSVADALNNVAYRDDSQITKVTVVKKYSDMPRVEVTIKRAEKGG